MKSNVEDDGVEELTSIDPSPKIEYWNRKVRDKEVAVEIPFNGML
jgi:hypothetical protein